MRIRWEVDAWDEKAETVDDISKLENPESRCLEELK